ncbi:MAG: DinB family protein [Actinomycetota bacterium]
MDHRAELMKLEDERWRELDSLIEKLTPEQLEQPGLNKEGWSAKDMMWHIGCWAAEAARELDRVRMGTYEDWDWGDDRTNRMNQEFLEAGKNVDLATAKAEMHAARTRALQTFSALPEVTPAAVEWFGESGHEHYDEHLPELRAWVAKLTGG